MTLDEVDEDDRMGTFPQSTSPDRPVVPIILLQHPFKSQQHQNGSHTDT